MKRIAMIMCCAALVLGGCASAGNKVLKNEDAKSVAAKIEKGKTTKADVRRMFGDPMTTSYTDSGNEIWKYEFTKTHSKVVNFIPVVNLFKSGAKGKKKELVVFFDQNGVVKNYSMSTSDVDVDTSLIQ